MRGRKKDEVGRDYLNEELMISYMDPADENNVILAAQLEWASRWQ